MRNFLSGIFVFTCIIALHAQQTPENNRIKKNKIKKEKKQGWTKRGKNSLLFNQAAFSNWIAGGVNSSGALANMDYEFNYQKGKNMWNNRITLAYGFQSNKDESTKKTVDNINLISHYRHQIKDTKWYFGTQILFQTQFTKGYDYMDLDKDGKDEKYETSNFLSPGYLQLGAGIDYVPNDHFELNIHPLNSKITFVSDDKVYREYDGIDSFDLKDKAFGVDYGDHVRYELGLFISARHKINIMKNINLDHRISLYTSYFEDPDHIDIFYSAMLNMTVNKYISVQFTGDLLYDHDQIKRLQVKQTLGVGLTYNFVK